MSNDQLFAERRNAVDVLEEILEVAKSQLKISQDQDLREAGRGFLLPAQGPQRTVNVGPLDELRGKFLLDTQQIADLVGKSRPRVADYIRTGGLPTVDDKQRCKRVDLIDFLYWYKENHKMLRNGS